MARVACPECKAEMKVSDDLPAGRKVRCPKCEAVFRPFEEEAGDPPDPPAAPAGRDRGRAAAPPEPRRRQRDDDDRDERAERKERDHDDEDRPRRPAKKGKSAVYWVLLVVAGLAAAGAIAFMIVILLRPARINEEHSLDLGKPHPGFPYDAISKDQKINISVNSSNGKIRLTVYKKQGKLPAGQISVGEYFGKPFMEAKNVGGEKTLEADIPADHAWAVMVERADGTPQVKLKISN